MLVLYFSPDLICRSADVGHCCSCGIICPSPLYPNHNGSVFLEKVNVLLPYLTQKR